MEQEGKKNIVIYYTQKRISLNNEAKAQMGKIEKTLKNTPFEKYTEKIFHYLLIIQILQHGDGAEIESAIRETQKELDIISSLLILQSATNFQIKCRYDKETKAKAQCSDIPKELIKPIKQAALNLYNKSLSLCMIPTGETWLNENTGESYNKTKYQIPTIEYLESKQKELKDKLSDLGKLKQANGTPTYIIEKPNELSPAFRKKCAITIFIKCKDAFNKNKWNTTKDRNNVIFKCLEVMGITQHKETENNINKLIADAMTLDVSTIYMYKDKEIAFTQNIPLIAVLKTH